MAAPQPTIIHPDGTVEYGGKKYRRTGSYIWRAGAVSSLGAPVGSRGTYSMQAPDWPDNLLIEMRFESANALLAVTGSTVVNSETMADIGTALANGKASSLKGIEMGHYLAKGNKVEGDVVNNTGGAITDVTAAAKFEQLTPL